jgi:ATP/ADP translocase
MGTMESLKFLVSSRYIRDLATLVVAYGISINLVEVTWKSKLKAQVIINKMVDLVFVSVLYRAMLLYAFSFSHESLQTAVS